MTARSNTNAYTDIAMNHYNALSDILCVGVVDNNNIIILPALHAHIY